MGDEIDLQTLVAALGFALEDGSGWSTYLNKYSNLLINSRKVSSISEVATDILDDSLEKITKSVLQLDNVSAVEETTIIKFLSEVLSTIIFYVQVRKKTKDIALMSFLFDPAQPFFAFNGHNQTSAYSAHLTTLTKLFQSKGADQYFLNLLSSPTITLEEVTNIIDVFQRMIKLGTYSITNKEQAAAQITTCICNILDEKKDRQIPYQQVYNIFDAIFGCIDNDRLTELAMTVMQKFAETDIAEVRLSGIRLAALVYTRALKNEQLHSEKAASCLMNLFKFLNRVEAFNALKPALIRMAKMDAIPSEMARSLLYIVSSQHASIAPQTLDIFCDIALESRNPQIFLEAVENVNPTLAVLGRLIEGPSYTVSASSELWIIVESKNDQTVQALKTLTKASQKADLGLLLPNALDFVTKEPKYVAEISEFVESVILNWGAADLDSAAFLEAVIKALKDTENVMSTIRCALKISEISSVNFTKEQLEIILSLVKKEGQTANTVRSLIPDRGRALIGADCSDVMINIVKYSGADIALLRHLHSAIPYSSMDCELRKALKEATEESVWNILLYPKDQDNRGAISRFMLEFTDEYEMLSALRKYTEKCMDVLENGTNSNAALFVTEILDKAACYVSPSSLGFEAHRFVPAEDRVRIHIKGSDLESDIDVAAGDRSEHLPAIVAASMQRDVNSIVLYYKGSVLRDLEAKSIKEDLEVRFKNEYIPAPQFDRETHPIAVISRHSQRLTDLLDSDISHNIYDILAQVPTPDNFKVENLDPGKKYLFLYQLHFLAKHRESVEALPIASLLSDNFDALVPEARLLMSSLIETPSPVLIGVAARLSKEPFGEMRNSALRRMLSLISDLDVEMTSEEISNILFESQKEFVDEALKMPLIKRQSFDSVWKVYKAHDEIKGARVISQLEIPKEAVSEVTSNVVPLVDSLDEGVLELLSKLALEDESFPVSEISSKMLECYIECVKPIPGVTKAAFDLISAMMRRSDEFKARALEGLEKTMPTTDKWSYAPTDAQRDTTTGRCGLQNLGATCYVNSVLQQFYSIEQFRNEIVSYRFDDPALSAISQLFTRMQFTHRHHLEMKPFAQTWTWWDGAPINPMEQQDANEFLMQLLTRLEGTPAAKLFTGVQRNVFEGGGKRVETKEEFTFLPVEISNQNNLEDSFRLFNTADTIENYKMDGVDGPISVKHQTVIDTLPHFLIIQLKRFEWSVQTGLKTKIDSPFDIQDDFEINGTPLRLMGVVVHQGDADVGHYFSYRRRNDKEWILLNDAGTSIVADSKMKEQANGREEFGTSAYLLFYERTDEEVPPAEEHPDPELMKAIEKDNWNLLVDSIYFSRPFNEFVGRLVGEKGADRVVFKYYMYTLTHTALEESFEEFTNVIIKMIQEENARHIYSDFITDNMQFIVEVMTKCTNTRVRMLFCDSIVALQRLLPVECDLTVILLSQLYDWFDQIVSNWRNGFDFFKLINDYALISDEHRQILLNFEVPSILLSFVNETIPNYISNKENKVPKDRFKRVCDLSWLLRSLKAIGDVPIEAYNPSFLKWAIGSQNCADALIEFIKDTQYMKEFDRIIERSKTAPSEELITTLASKTSFVVPSKWLTEGSLASSEAHGRLSRALRNVEDIESFVQTQKNLFTILVFSSSIDARSDMINVLRAKKSPRLFELLTGFLVSIPVLSRKIYQTSSKASALPFSMFPGFDLLSLLLELAPLCESPARSAPAVSESLWLTAREAGKYDQHLPLLAQLLCFLLKSDLTPIDFVAPEFVQTVRSSVLVLARDHTQLDATLRMYFALLSRLTEQSRLSGDELFPEDGSKALFFGILLGSVGGVRTAQKAAVALAQQYSKRYALASKLVRGLTAELSNSSSPSPQAMREVFEVISFLKADCISNNISGFVSPKPLAAVLNGVSALSPADPFLEASLSLACQIVDAANAHVESVVRANPGLAAPLLRLSADDRTPITSRNISAETAASLLKYSKDVFARVFPQGLVVSEFLDPQSADSFGASVLLALAANWPAGNAPEDAQRRAAAEVTVSLRTCARLSVSAVQRVNVWQYGAFLREIGGDLAKIWESAPNGQDLMWLVELSAAVAGTVEGFDPSDVWSACDEFHPDYIEKLTGAIFK